MDILLAGLAAGRSADMIYALFALLGLPEPSLMVAAFASTVLVLGVIFGLMFLVATQQRKSYQRNRGTNLLRDERRAYYRYLSSAEPVEQLVKPALEIFHNALLHRGGITYPEVFYKVHDDTVELIARRASVHPLRMTQTLELPFYLFDPDQPLGETIWEKVLARHTIQTES